VSAKDFFSKLESRKQGRHTARKGRATQRCPLTSGDVLVCVYKLSNFEAIPGMAVDIPGLGAATTDDMGVAEWLEQTPGAYTYAVQHANSAYAGKMWRGDNANFGLGANSVSLHIAGVASSGALKVEVRLRSTDDLLPAADVHAIEGTGELSEGEAERSFDPLPVGAYTVVAKLKPNLYSAETVRSATVEVREDETSTVVLRVDELTWVELAVRDMTGRRYIAGCRAALDMPNGALLTEPTDALGVARADVSAAAQSCTLRHVTTPGDTIYELIEII
jgi:hypothetical protein